MSAATQPGPLPAEVLPVRKEVAPEPGRPKRWLAGFILLALIIGAVVAYRIITKPPSHKAAPVAAIRTTRITRGAVVRSLRVSGQTSARNYAAITVPILRGPESRRDLTLLKLADPGSMVNKGAVIAELDPTNAKDHLDDTNDTVAQAEADIRKRKAEQEAEWFTLEQTLREAKADLDKAALEERASEVRTQVERELLKLNADEARARYKEMQSDLANRKAAQAAEIAILQTTLQRQINHRDRHVHDLKRFSITSPMKGLLVAQQVWRGGEMGQVQQGDQVSPGQLILKVVDSSTMQIEGSVNQSESSGFRIGQKAEIGLDAFPDLRFHGRVYSIGALAVGGWRTNYYIRNVPIRIAIEANDPRIIPDLSAWADVELARQDNAVVVPLEAVHSEQGKEFVYVKSGTRFEKREVRLGLRNEVQAAVLSGLEPGQEVALEKPLS